MANDESWRRTSFRKNIMQKMEEAIKPYGYFEPGDLLNTEEDLYQQAETKAEYLGVADTYITNLRKLRIGVEFDARAKFQELCRRLEKLIAATGCIQSEAESHGQSDGHASAAPSPADHGPRAADAGNDGVPAQDEYADGHADDGQPGPAVGAIGGADAEPQQADEYDEWEAIQRERFEARIFFDDLRPSWGWRAIAIYPEIDHAN